MHSLPPEVLERIFTHLDENDLLSAERVSQLWSNIITNHFWRPRLLSLASEDFSIAIRICGKLDLREWRSLYLDCFCAERKPQVAFVGEDKALRQSAAAEFSSVQVNLVYSLDEDRLVLGLRCGSIEVWSLSKMCLLQCLRRNEAQTENDALLTSCQLDVNRRAGLIVCVDEAKQGLHLLDITTGTTLDSMKSPIEAPIYDVKMSMTNLAFLVQWKLVVLPILHASHEAPRLGRKPEILDDQGDTAEANDQAPFMNTHQLQINQKYIVTTGTWREQNGAIDRRRSFLRVRPAEGADRLRPLGLGFLEAWMQNEVETTRLSPSDNLLAVLMIGGVDTASPGYCIEIADLDQGVVISRLPPSSSILSAMILPVSWLGPQLFVKLVPEPVAHEYVTLAAWNVRTNCLRRIDHVAMISANDCLVVGRLGVVRVYSAFPAMTGFLTATEDVDKSTFEVRASIYKLKCRLQGVA